MKRFHIWFLLLLPALFACDRESPSYIIPNTSFTEESYGCKSLTVYKVNSVNDVALTVIGHRERLNLSTSESAFELEEMDDVDLSVVITQFNQDASAYYCNDVLIEDYYRVIDEWRGLIGTVSMKIVEDELATNALGEPEYTVNVQLDNVTLENDNGDKIYLENVVFSEVYVGWLPG